MDTIIPNDQPAPLFSLPSLDGQIYRLEDQRSRVVVLNFWSAECPWSERGDQELLSYLPSWGERVAWWTIASNANEPPNMIGSVASERSLPLVLLDSQHQVADLYGAQATPHLFVLDSDGILCYQGALNDRTFRQRVPTCFYLHDAVEAVLSGSQPDPDQTTPYGCAIVRYQI